MSDPFGAKLGVRWSFEADDEVAVKRARRECVRLFEAAGCGLETSAVGELVFGELVGNAQRYARGVVEVGLTIDREHAVLEVHDVGPGFSWTQARPAAPYAESGRGLYIVSLISDEFDVVRRAGGGTTARAVIRFVWSQRSAV